MDTDPMLAAYLGVCDRVLSMAGSAGHRLDLNVPSCPDWTARDVIAHLAGLCQDWVDGNLDNYGTVAWTAAQVDRFGSSSIDEVVGAWQVALEEFAALTESPLGATPSRWAFGDALAHEADLRPVLAPGTRAPDDGVALGLQAGIARWRGELAAAEAPVLRIIAPGLREWWAGEAAANAASVTADPYELYRALYGRRSRAQVEAWQWSSDPAPWLDLGLPFPFTWALADIVD